MAVMDEFQEERETIKNGTVKQKLRYFYDYYRGPAFIVCMVAILIIYIIYQIVTAKEALLYTAFLNCSSTELTETMSADFMEYIEMDPKEYTISIDANNFFTLDGSDQTSTAVMQKLTAYVSAGSIDVMAGGGKEFRHYANTVLFCDLRSIMTREQIAKYEPYFYYVDMAIILEEDGTAKSPLDIDPAQIQDPRKPEDMEKPVPVAIYVDSCKKLSDRYLFGNSEEGIALGVCGTSSNKDTAVQFIEYLFE